MSNNYLSDWRVLFIGKSTIRGLSLSTLKSHFFNPSPKYDVLASTDVPLFRYAGVVGFLSREELDGSHQYHADPNSAHICTSTSAYRNWVKGFVVYLCLHQEISYPIWPLRLRKNYRRILLLWPDRGLLYWNQLFERNSVALLRYSCLSLLSACSTEAPKL